MKRQPVILTTNLKWFFRISGLIYFSSTIVAIGLDISLIFYSSWTWYLGFSGSGVWISAGITALIVSCYSTYTMIYLLWTYIPTLAINLIVWILSIINLVLHRRCNSSSSETSSCESSIAFSLKVILLTLFSLPLVHTALVIVIIVKNSIKSRETLSTDTD